MLTPLIGKTWAWPFKALRQIFHKHSRFVFTRPPFVEGQVLFDKKTQSTLTIKMRDHIDYAVIKSIFAKGDYNLATLTRSDDIYARYQEICAAGETPLIVDAGANIGASTLYFAHEFPNAKVIGLEPEPNNFKLASENCSHVPNIHILQAGLANAPGRAKIQNPNADNWAFQTQADTQGDLELVSLNQLLIQKQQNGKIPFLVKIDVEGFEENIFASNTEWVDQFQVLIIELHDWMLPGQANSSSFLQCISSLGRDFIYRSENVFSIKN